MRIEFATFSAFPPFADGVLSFPQLPGRSTKGEVQFFTGQNGTGKTRILSLLIAACGNPHELNRRMSGLLPNAYVGLTVSGRKERKVIFAFGTNQWGLLNGEFPSLELLLQSGSDLPHFRAWVEPPLGTSESKPQVPEVGTALAFRGMAVLSDTSVEALKPVQLGAPSTHLVFSPAKNEDEIIAQSMTNLKIVAAMEMLEFEDQVGPLPRSAKLASQLEQAVTDITGRRFSFDVKRIPTLTLQVKWGGTSMLFHQLPDGLRSIIGWMVGCIAKLDSQFPEHPDPLSIPVTLLLDEPESHLHPSWQRRVLPAMQTLLPRSQIFCVTHSPFIISSVNEGWIHVFRRNDDGLVVIDKPLACGKGDSYLDVIEDILGVSEWYDPESEKLLEEFRGLKSQVIAGDHNLLTDLQAKADAIAKRGAALSDLMGKEMHQIKQLIPDA